MHSLQSGQDEVDLSGLHESVVDSDEEDLAESIGSFTLRDAVRDCLEKDPADRQEEDIEILMEFTHTLEAFADMTQAVRMKMCAAMVFAVVDKAGTVVMNDGEELDSWSVIINGAVRVEGPSRFLYLYFSICILVFELEYLYLYLYLQVLYTEPGPGLRYQADDG